MSIGEGARHRLYERLRDVLGDDEATTMMDHLPPGGWREVASKADLARTEETLRGEIARTEETLRGEIALLRSDLERSHASLRREILTFRHEVVAELRGDMLQQTRTMLFTMVGVVLTIAGLALAT